MKGNKHITSRIIKRTIEDGFEIREEEVEISTLILRTKVVNIFNMHNIDKTLDSLDKELAAMVGEINHRASNLTLPKINYFAFDVYKIKPPRGSSYIPTPATFANPNSGLINIKNNDNKCFKWCMTYHQCDKIKYSKMLSVFNKVEDKYNYEGVNFPAGHGDIKQFEENNKVCVNVYATKKENEETIIVKESLGNVDYMVNDVINLLRVSDEDEEVDEDGDGVPNSHYIYILKTLQNYSNYAILEKTRLSIAIFVMHALNVMIYVSMLKKFIRVNIEMVL